MPESITDKILTRSLWVASYLILKGHSFEAFKMKDAHNGEFVFKRDEYIEKNISDYYGCDPKVRIRRYLEHYNNLRTIVMRKKRQAQRPIGGR